MTDPQNSTGLRRWLQIEPDERRLVAWAAGLNFFLLAAYYTVRPIRDEIASQYLELRSELFGYTFLATVLAGLTFAALTKRVSRSKLIPGTFFLLTLQLVCFRAYLPAAGANPDSPLIERCFYVWVSVFGMVGVSILWSLVSDSFRSGQAKRVFGLFFFASTLGQVSASSFVLSSATDMHREGLLTVACWLVLAAALCTLRLGSLHSRSDASARTPFRSGLWAGLVAIGTSPQLRRICLYIVTYTFGSTILYYMKTNLMSEAFQDRGERISFYARLDLFIGIASLLPQLFLTNRVIGRVGLARTLMILPAAGIIGFAALALAPGFVVLVAFECLRRSLNFIFAKPSREVLYTGVTPEQRFQAKPVIDTAWLRGTDWLEFTLLDGIAPSLTTAAWLGVPIAALGLWVGRGMGRAHEAREEAAAGVAGSIDSSTGT